MKKTLLAVVAAIAGCAAPLAIPPKPAARQVIATPTFDAHCRACKQCGGGLLDENGQEQSLCEEGFRLWQEDLRRTMGE